MLSDPTKSPRVCVIRNPWPPLGLSWHSPACCSLTPCPAFLAARRLILPKMISSPSGRSSRRGPGALQHSPGLVGSRSGWVTSECGSGMMQGPAARHTAPVSHCSSVTPLQCHTAPARRPGGRSDAAAPKDAVRTDDNSSLSRRGLVPWFNRLFLWHGGMF